MGETTAIAWTDHTFNPWVGCARVSPGCTNCYAEAMSHRWGHDRWGKNAERHVTSDVYWRQPLKWNRAAEEAGRPALVFCASQADVFEDRPDLVAPRERLWDLIAATPHLTWQLLTKRPENIVRLTEDRWLLWPDNVWIGTTVEDQARAEERIERLLRIPAAVRFLSCEPLLGRVSFRDEWVARHRSGWEHLQAGRIDWVICGGESGPHHRPMDLAHARSLADQCEAYRIPFFFKQVGGRTAATGGDLLDDVQLKAFPEQAGPRDGVPVEVTARG